MLQASTLQLLRFRFSFFLMPVFWFALSQTPVINYHNAISIFVILHLLVYPASNGYNSFMDRDTESIGGIKNPKQPTRQLLYATILLDLVALIWSLFIDVYFFTGILVFILASKAYSYRKIRLKRYPVIGYLTVIIFQGGLVYWIVINTSNADNILKIDLIGMIAAALLVGSFYPLTQIYQHMQDREDGVTTLSYKLGYRGTFIFTAIIYAAAMTFLAILLSASGDFKLFLIVQLFQLPVLSYFLWWFAKVYLNHANANFENTMRMNVIASLFSNAAFIFLFIIKHY